MKRAKYLVWSLVFILGSCDLLDCTNYSVKGLNAVFYDSEGYETYLEDTLTVKACGTDSILVNKDFSATEILVPMSYESPVDTFLLVHHGEGYTETDSLFVSKTNDQFFESPDCPTRMMHTLLEARLSGGHFTDSVKIVNASIGFVKNLNLKLYLKL